MRPALTVLVSCAVALLAGCDLLGLDSTERIAAIREADGKAIGSACRHAGRAIEDCYMLNPKAQRPAIFAGWREMDEYMRDNKLETVAPVLAGPASVASGGEAAAPAAPATPAEESSPAKSKATAS
jgi:hypothetical protein